jgi:prevent-host-death family protein
MSRASDVKPITYLKTRAADLVREVHDAGRAVTITQNGQAKVVVMDVHTYDRWRSAMALLKLLARAEADVDARRVVSQEAAFRRARTVLKRVLRDR